MTKGTDTRRRIVREAAGLFNQKGYVGASMSDVMARTGLQKGGIYRHFPSKDELALEAFDFAVAETGRRIRARLAEESSALGRLEALVSVFSELAARPAVPGGCPVVNAAIESDDGYEPIRERTRVAMKRLLGIAEQIVAQGVTNGEIRPATDTASAATAIISLLEGGLLLTRLYGDDRYLEHVSQHLRNYIQSELRAV